LFRCSPMPMGIGNLRRKIQVTFFGSDDYECMQIQFKVFLSHAARTNGSEFRSICWIWICNSNAKIPPPLSLSLFLLAITSGGVKMQRTQSNPGPYMHVHSGQGRAFVRPRKAKTPRKANGSERAWQHHQRRRPFPTPHPPP
jgi:hypothetical protein